MFGDTCDTSLIDIKIYTFNFLKINITKLLTITFTKKLKNNKNLYIYIPN